MDTLRDVANTPPASRSRAPIGFNVLLASYALAAMAMLVFVVRPSLVMSEDSHTNTTAMRAVFACAFAVNVTIVVAGRRRLAWARGLAIAAHVSVALIALFGVATFAAGHPLLGSKPLELVIKCLVHVAAALIWRSAWARRCIAAR